MWEDRKMEGLKRFQFFSMFNMNLFYLVERKNEMI